jgi:hypothetical protein
MLATLGGLLALPLGLAVLLLPLLANELSRPRDSLWGAVVLLLGLVLVTSSDRLTGAPMLGVLCGGLLLGRLALEVGQGRWRQLTEEEQGRLGSLERWTTSLGQLGITLASLGGRLGGGVRALGAGLQPRAGGRSKGKRWVRPEGPTEAAAAADSPVPEAAGTNAGPPAEASEEAGVPAAPAPQERPEAPGPDGAG